MRGPVTLVSLPGAVPYLEEDLRAAHHGQLTVLRRETDRITIESAISLHDLAAIGPYSTAELPLGSIEGFADTWPPIIESACEQGLLSALTQPNSDAANSPPNAIRFRVGDLGPARWQVRDWLESTYGWHNDPHDWHVNLEARGPEVSMQVGAFHSTARFGELVRLPASTTPVLAAVMCRLAKPAEATTVVDPFCGAGSLLVTCARNAPHTNLIGADTNERALQASRTNLHASAATQWAVLRSDAATWPFADASIERVVSNIPFGKRIGSHAGNERLYPAMLRELARVLGPKGRAVLLTEDKRLFTESVQRTRGIRIIKEVQFTTGGAHPSAYVIAPGRSGRASSAGSSSARAMPRRRGVR